MPERSKDSGTLRVMVQGWIRPAAVLSVIFTLCYFSILQADFLYRDDLRRAAEGFRGWGFGRYLSLAFSLVLHTDTYLADISPLPQLLAVVLTALACVILHRILKGNDDFSIWEYIALLPVGLYPYYLGCISYKYDSPYMAFSALVSLLPFLALDAGKLRYILAVFLSTMAMCMTYQASSGIFPAVAVLLAVLAWTKEERSIGGIFRFLSVSAAGYLAGLVVFRLFFVRWGDEYVDTSLAGPDRFLTVAAANYRKYASLFLREYRLEWKLCMIVVCIAGIWAIVRCSKRRKWMTLVLTIAGAGASTVLSLGVYPFLTNPLFQPRAMYGTGFPLAFLSLCAILHVQRRRILLSALKISPVDVESAGFSGFRMGKGTFGVWAGSFFIKLVVLSTGFMFAVFAFTYGNALDAQANYTDFRVRQIVSDLSSLEEFHTEGEKLVQLSGDMGFAPLIDHMPEDYRLILRLVPHTLKGGYMWGEYGFFHDFGLEHIIQDDTVDLTKENLPVLLESSFHIISGDGKHFLIRIL